MHCTTRAGYYGLNASLLACFSCRRPKKVTSGSTIRVVALVDQAVIYTSMGMSSFWSEIAVQFVMVSRTVMSSLKNICRALPVSASIGPRCT